MVKTKTNKRDTNEKKPKTKTKTLKKPREINEIPKLAERPKRGKDKQDFKRKILHDIAGSFFSDLIGQHMDIFVNAMKTDILNELRQKDSEDKKVLDKIHGVEKFYIEYFSDKKLFEKSSKKPLYDNAIVPKPLGSFSKNVNVVHWVFCVKKTETKTKLTRDDFKVYDPYVYGMQLPDSHQFCQSHALHIARNYYLSKKIKKYRNVKDAYIDLLDFWKYLFHLPDVRFAITPELIKEVLDPIKRHNTTSEQSHPTWVKEVIDGFPTDLNGIYEIMTTEDAIAIFPTWK
jgi:hypothetical protein